MRKFLFWIAICLPTLSWAGGERVDIARFSRGDLHGWQKRAFAGETRYSLDRKSVV